MSHDPPGEIVGQRLDDALSCIRSARKRVRNWQIFYRATGIAEGYLVGVENTSVWLFNSSPRRCCVRFDKHPGVDAEAPAGCL
jgi:hypothetical protein